MSNRTLFVLVAIVLASMGIVFAMNIGPLMNAHSSEKHVRLNDIRGMAVVYKGKEYTLNFDQQNEVALLLNSSVLVSKEADTSTITLAPFDKIVIYLFDAATVEITPVGFKNDDLIFSAPAWNPSGYLKDVSNGTLKHILINTYDI